MFQNLTNIFRKPLKPHVHPHVPKNQRIYCIGDIHGRADLLAQLHKKIQRDAKPYKGKKTIVYLGDYVDRGEQSRQVIDILLSEPLKNFESIFLKGNHEQAMLDFIEFPVSRYQDRDIHSRHISVRRYSNCRFSNRR